MKIEFGPHFPDDEGEVFLRPPPHHDARAGMQADERLRHAAQQFIDARRTISSVFETRRGGVHSRKAECVADVAPILDFVLLLLRADERVGEECGAPFQRKTVARPRIDEPHHEMIPRIVAHRDGGIEPLVAESREEREQFAPVPFPQPVFVPIRGPRRVVIEEADLWKRRLKQWARVRLSHDRHIVALDGGAQHRRGKREVAQTPKLKDEELRSGFRG